MYVKVAVIAGVKKEKFTQTKEDHFEIWVKEKAERNMANMRVLELIAGHFKIPLNKVRIINGHTHPHKLLVLDL